MIQKNVGKERCKKEPVFVDMVKIDVIDIGQIIIIQGIENNYKSLYLLHKFCNIAPILYFV